MTHPNSVKVIATVGLTDWLTAFGYRFVMQVGCDQGQFNALLWDSLKRSRYNIKLSQSCKCQMTLAVFTSDCIVDLADWLDTFSYRCRLAGCEQSNTILCTIMIVKTSIRFILACKNAGLYWTLTYLRVLDISIIKKDHSTLRVYLW